MELLWLLAVALVPLIFAPTDSMTSTNQLPKVTLFRTLVGLMTMLWILEWALRGQLPGRFSLEGWWGRFKARVGEEPTRWVVVAVTLFLGVNVLSTLLSASFRVSLWGKAPGEDGYGLYTVASYVLLFLVMVTHLKRQAQLWRLLGVIVATGVLVGAYGVLQYYNLDPFGLVKTGGTRVVSTLGNAIFAAAVLVMTIPLSLAVALVVKERMNPLWRVPLGGVVIAVQLLAVIFTLSRGPWVGLCVGLLGFLVLTWLAFDWRNVARSLLILGPALAITLIVTSVPAFSYRAPEEQAGPAAIVTAATRAASIGEDVVVGGLSGRLHIWRGSTELILERPWIDFLGDPLSLLRPLVGYGPDLFRHAFPLRSPPALHVESDGVAAYAHNHILHETVELGFLGLLSYLGLLVAIFTVGGVQLIRGRRLYSAPHKWLLVALLAIVGGLVVEQMAGIPRVGDLTILWALLAVFVVLPRVMRPSVAQLATTGSPQRGKRRRDRSGPVDEILLWRLAIAVVFMAFVGYLTWDRNVDYVRADVAAASAARISEKDSDKSLQLLNRAIALAPDVTRYYRFRAEMYDGFRDLVSEPSKKIYYAELSYLDHQQALKVNPLSIPARQHLANSALELAFLGQEEKASEALGQYERLSRLLPRYWRPYNILAAAYLDVGQPRKALEALERSLSFTGGSSKSARAFLLQGVAYIDLGEEEKAVASIEKSLSMGLTENVAEAYGLLADLYTRLGDLIRAEENKMKYEELVGGTRS